MRIDHIKISKEFFVLGAGEWITASAWIEDGDDPKECVRKLRQEIIDVYGHDANRIMPAIQKNMSLENDPEFDTLKLELDKFNNKENAISYLGTTDFRLSLEAKNYVNQKFI